MKKLFLCVLLLFPEAITAADNREEELMDTSDTRSELLNSLQDEIVFQEAFCRSTRTTTESIKKQYSKYLSSKIDMSVLSNLLNKANGSLQDFLNNSDNVQLNIISDIQQHKASLPRYEDFLLSYILKLEALRCTEQLSNLDPASLGTAAGKASLLRTLLDKTNPENYCPKSVTQDISGILNKQESLQLAAYKVYGSTSYKQHKQILEENRKNRIEEETARMLEEALQQPDSLCSIFHNAVSL